jgi:uncharacterized protein (TIGR03086 family)
MYERASKWTLEKVKGAGAHLDGGTPCGDWDLRTLLAHMLETERYFAATARGDKAAPPSQPPPAVIGDDLVAAFEESEADLLAAFGEPGAIERTGPLLKIALADQLLHGWDVAKASGQDTTMPDGLAESAYGIVSSLLPDDQRKGFFDPAIPISPSASMQDKLIAFSGRDLTAS